MWNQEPTARCGRCTAGWSKGVAAAEEARVGLAREDTLSLETFKVRLDKTEQLLEGVPACYKGIGLDDLQSSLSTQNIL